MKKFIVLSLVTVGLLAGTWSYAADNPPGLASPTSSSESRAAGSGLPDKGKQLTPQEQLEKRVEHLKNALSLTADQEPKVRAVLAAMRDKMKAIRDEADNAIAALLTPEQKVKFETEKAKRLERPPVK